MANKSSIRMCPFNGRACWGDSCVWFVYKEDEPVSEGCAVVIIAKEVVANRQPQEEESEPPDNGWVVNVAREEKKP